MDAFSQLYGCNSSTGLGGKVENVKSGMTIVQQTQYTEYTHILISPGHLRVRFIVQLTLILFSAELNGWNHNQLLKLYDLLTF